MNCAGSTIYDCIQSVCESATEVMESYEGLEATSTALIDTMAAYGEVLKCVVDGPEGLTCTTPTGVVHQTVAGRIADLNADSINSVDGEQFVATAGQTDFTMAQAEPNGNALEVKLNGAFCRFGQDYSTLDTTLSFALPLEAGDTVDYRRFAT